MQTYSNHSFSITVEFGEVSGATAYILRAEKSDGFFSESVVFGSPGTIFNLSAYTDYTLSVMSRNSGGHSQPSFPVKAKTGKQLMHSVSQLFFPFSSGVIERYTIFLSVILFLYSYWGIIVFCETENYYISIYCLIIVMKLN